MPCPNVSSAEDCTSVFLGHSQLYVFAEKWGLESLEALVLHKLLAKIYECEFTEAPRHERT